MKTTISRTAITVTALAMLLAAGGAPAQPQTNSVPLDAPKAVLDRLSEIQSAAQALDPDKVFSFVLENDQGAVAQNGRLFLTRAAALESTKQGFQGLAKVSYHFDQQHVTMLSPTTALVVGEGSSSATTVDGRTFENRFAQSVVLVLTNGDWRVFHSHRSFLPGR